MTTRSPADHLADFVAGVVTDVREKVVDEGWFSRVTAPQERVSQEVSEFIGQQRDMATPTLAATPMRAMTWDDVCAQMGKEQKPEPDRDINHELER